MTHRSHRSSGRASFNVRQLVVTLMVLAVGGILNFQFIPRLRSRMAVRITMRYADREPAPCHAIAGEGEIMVGIADQDDRGPRGAGRDPPGACSGGPPPDSRGPLVA